ncbi:MAG: exonuclease domain-containing protein [Clostridiales bacterium]|nr:exonuclease domain-containing protein [Clostridiales bacterium]
MKHIVVDLEMNTVDKKSEARKICRLETIEIGAVMLDDNLQEISSFRTYVKPEYNDEITEKITWLTGITDAMVENAPRFNEALHMFGNWCLGTDDEVRIYAWSDSDFIQITKEMELKGYEMSVKEKEIFENKWYDFQKEFDSKLGFERQVSLNTALDLAGVDFNGREHDALDDARNTASLLQIFRDEELFEKQLRVAKETLMPKRMGSAIGDLFDFSGFAFA